MASTASSNLTRLRVIPEVTFGTTPGSGSSKDLRFTGESLNFGITTETSQEIRSDRQIADLIQTGAETTGDIQFELSYGSYDEFIAAALGGAWASNVLTNGSNVPFFSIEKGFTDINQFLLYRGMAVNTFSLDFSIGAILTGSFGFIGRDAVVAGTSGVPSAPPPASLTEVMNSAANFADLTVAGVSYPCGISQITLSTEAGLRAQNALGNLGACSIIPGTFTPTGELTVYFADGVIYDKYIKNEAFALSWSVEDGAGNRYEFELPRIKVTEATVNAGGLDQDVELSISYQALYDAEEGCSIRITRTPAPAP